MNVAPNLSYYYDTYKTEYICGAIFLKGPILVRVLIKKNQGQKVYVTRRASWPVESFCLLCSSFLWHLEPFAAFWSHLEPFGAI